jgi:hypothetical protein
MRFARVLSAGLGILALSVTGLAAGEPKKESDEGYRVPSERRSPVRLAGVMVGASYSRGGFWYPYYPYAFGGYWRPYWGIYDPFWYSPWVSPVLYTGWRGGPSTGSVKLRSADRSASVYVDGAFAGTVEKLKTFQLEPGAYNVEVRGDQDKMFKKRIYVLSGKTLELNAELEPAEKEERP